jgi:glycosyltransferase involved in cell wall biosynthesis
LRPEIPVIVVDDGSQVPAADALGDLEHFSLRIARKPNGGPASPRNLGVALARTSLLAFTDDDCVPEGRWPESLERCLAESPPEVAGVGGRVLPL